MITRFLIFFGVSSSMLFGIHYYLWARLVRDAGLPSPYRQLATAALIVFGVSIPASFAVMRALPISRSNWLSWPAYLWMGFMALLFVILVGGDLVRLTAHAGRKLAGAPPLEPERRAMLGRLFASGALLFAGGAGAAGIWSARRKLGVEELDVPLKRLPPELDGLTIVQITDIHVGPTIGRDFLERIVAKVNSLDADVVAITGDLVDGSVEQLRDMVAPLAQIKAKRGVFFVTGNHEYYSGVEEWLAHLPTLGIQVLRNRRVTIAPGLDLAGVEDPTGRHDLPAALAGRDPAHELVLLAHQPRSIHEASAAGVGLQLSGHTHGGQIWPWNFLVRLQQPYVAGFFKHGETHLYVSRGTGYWGPPMRVGAPAEVTRLKLRRASLS